MLDTHTSIYKPCSLKKSNTQEFIQKAILVHGKGKYNYSKVVYDKCSVKVTIICHVDGEFNQTPNNHLKGQGCPKCGKTGKLTTDEFIKKAILVHGYLYIYSKIEYKRSRSKVIIVCPIHGEFIQSPSNHLKGRGCPNCKTIARRSTTEEFIKNAIFVHGEGKYNYSKVEYKDSKSKVIIICPIHKSFKQTPATHLQNHGCPFCKAENQRIRNKIRFENKYNIATLYLLKCWKDNETFLKIGITSQTISRRYHTDISMPYKYETLYEWRGDSKSVVDMENKIKTTYIYHKPEIMFGGGHTETLHISQKDVILELLNEISD